MKRYWLIGLALLFWFISLGLGYQMIKLDRFVTVGLKEGITSKKLDHLLEAEKLENLESMPEITTWKKLSNEEVKNDGMNKTQSMDCYLVWGNMSQVLGKGLTSGNYGFRSDQNGCIVSAKAAQQLFRSIDVVGKSINCKGKLWIIRGVMDYDKAVVMIPALEDEKLLTMSFQYATKNRLNARTNEFFFRYNISDILSFTDGSFLGAVARLGFMIPIWILVIRIIGYFKDRLKKPWQQYSLAIFIGILLLLGLKLTFQFPDDFIPTQWSDFDFWVRKWEQTQKDLSNLYDSNVVGKLVGCLGAAMASALIVASVSVVGKAKV